MSCWRATGLTLAAACLSAFPANGQSVGAEIGFTRILPGWTNYSTAFLATHDTAAADYSTLAASYTPTCDVQPIEFAAILIWNGPLNQSPDFAAYQFQVGVWSTLTAFTNSPASGDVTNWLFAAPTGGSTTTPDTFTRGGRPAWLLRFALPSAITFTNRQPKFLALIAHGDSSHEGDLFIPTSAFRGPSDVQASSLLIGGWTYLVNAGGSTIYDGQLALELRVAISGAPPRLTAQPGGGFLRIGWPASAGCYRLETRTAMEPTWLTVSILPNQLGNELFVFVPLTGTQEFFRLAR